MGWGGWPQPGEERGGNSCVFGMRLPSGEPMTEREKEEEEEEEAWG